MKGNPDSGILEMFACTIRNRKKHFAYGIWNPEYVAQAMQNLESSPGRRRFAENTDSHNIFSSNKTIQCN